MIGLDRDAVAWLNQFSGRLPELDRWISFAAFSDLLKGAIPVTALCWLWFAGDGERRDGRRRAIASLLLLVVVALTVNRAVASALPHTPRPLQALAGSFDPPGQLDPRTFSELSSFPSDHAVLFIALSTGVLGLSVSLGSLLLGHALVIVLLPRVYLGLHWPTDILIGAAAGAVVASLATRTHLRDWLGGPLLAWESRHGASFYALGFLLCWQLATLFDPIVRLARMFSLPW